MGLNSAFSDQIFVNIGVPIIAKSLHRQIPALPHIACGNARKSRTRQIRHLARAASYCRSRNSRLRQVTANRAIGACSKLPRFSNRSGIFTYRATVDGKYLSCSQKFFSRLLEYIFGFKIFWPSLAVVGAILPGSKAPLLLRPPSAFSPIRTLYPGQNQ